jgi:hypothetical protein
MHVNRGLLGWGVFFLALGAVPLAVQSGRIDTETAGRAWELWPLLLIGAGLALVLRRTPLAALGAVLVGLTFGLMAGGLVAGGSGPGSIALCGIGGGTESAPNAPVTTGSLAAQASVELSVDCGSATATTQPGSDWKLAWPSGGNPPDVNASSPSRLVVDMRNRNRFGVGEPRSQWSLALPTDPTIDLSLSVNAGSANLGLAAAKARSASLSVNAGDAKVDLGGSTGMQHVDGSENAGSLSVALPPPAAELTGSFSANVGTVRICLPASVPVRVTVDDQTLGSTNLGQRGFVQNGDTWVRGAWDGASSRITLDVSTNLGSVTFDPEGGCG